MINVPSDRESREQFLLSLSFLSDVNLDLETTGLVPFKDKILLVIVSTPKEVCCIENTPENFEFLKRLFEAIKDKYIRGANLKFDSKFIFHYFGILFTKIIDTYIQSRIIFNGLTRSHSLEACVQNMFKDYLSRMYNIEEKCCTIVEYKKIKNLPQLQEIHDNFKQIARYNPNMLIGTAINEAVEKLFDKTVRMEFTKKDFVLQQKHIDYAIKDVAYIDWLVKYHSHYIQQYELEFLHQIESEFVPVLVIAEMFGVRVDIPRFRQTIELNKERLIDMDLKMRQHIELMLSLRGLDSEYVSSINFASPTQLLKLFKLFDNRICSTGGDYLLQFVRDNEVDTLLLALIRYLVGENQYDKTSYRSLTKLYTTYGEKFLSYVREGYIRTEFKQVSTTTGRLASGDLKEEYTNNKGGTSEKKANMYVNLQNLPKDEEFRSCFIAEEGKSIITIDMQAAEVRIAASLSQCKFLLDSLNQGVDFHSYFAQQTFRIVTGDNTLIVTNKINTKYRNTQKTITFGLFYGAGPGKIAEVLNVSLAVAKKVYDAMKVTLPELFAYLEKVSNFTVKNGYLTSNSVTNRRRWFGEYINYREDMTTFGIPFENLHSVRREASNFPIQGTNADMVKYAAINIEKYLRLKYGEDYSNRQLFWVHDEFVIQVEEGEAEEDKKNIEAIIIESCTPFLKGLSMEVEGKIAKHWLK